MYDDGVDACGVTLSLDMACLAFWNVLLLGVSGAAGLVVDVELGEGPPCADMGGAMELVDCPPTAGMGGAI
jgi:hypothetical protein